MGFYDVIVIGGGPAGLASAITSNKNGAKTLLIEREEKLGGILKQCIHDGFGLTRYGEKLTGPEYAQRDIDELEKLDITVKLSTFVTKIRENEDGYEVEVTNHNGMECFQSKAIVLATGCRERTSKQVFIHGSRPAGIFNAGTAQNLVNLMGYLPAKRCVILGSGDIGLIMARRLTLEGVEVEGVYEVKPTPSGLRRNISQCLDDFNIPLHLSTTVTKVFGTGRLEAVEVVKVDDKMQPIKGTERIIPCDGLILSVGLIPENEIAESLKVVIDNKTKGPVVDNNLHSLKDGIFVCGNCLSVNDLVDYVSENGQIAGFAASEYAKAKKERKLVAINSSKEFLYNVPQYVDLNSLENDITIYLRAKMDYQNKNIVIKRKNEIVYQKRCKNIKSAEAIRIKLANSKLKVEENEPICVEMEDA